MKVIRPTGFIMLRANARARRDYHFARGTFHLRQIDSALQNLQRRIDHLRRRLSDIQGQLHRLETEKKEELKTRLLQQLVSQGLEEVPGIGKSLAQEILSRCYDGTLESLSRAYLYVKGIGEKRQHAINQWIATVKAQLPTLLNQDFPHKAEIISKYQAQAERLEQTKKAVKKELHELSVFQRKVMKEISWLKAVSPEHFVRAYQGDEGARDLVHRYLIGLFP